MQSTRSALLGGRHDGSAEDDGRGLADFRCMDHVVSKSQNCSEGDYARVIQGPYSRAVRLYVGSFDRGSLRGVWDNFI